MYVLHDLAELDMEPRSAGFDAVIYGHSHRPSVETKHDVLYFNPGSAGPQRFRLPITVGRLTLSRDTLQADTLDLSESA